VASWQVSGHPGKHSSLGSLAVSPLHLNFVSWRPHSALSLGCETDVTQSGRNLIETSSGLSSQKFYVPSQMDNVQRLSFDDGHADARSVSQIGLLIKEEPGEWTQQEFYRATSTMRADQAQEKELIATSHRLGDTMKTMQYPLRRKANMFSRENSRANIESIKACISLHVVNERLSRERQRFADESTSKAQRLSIDSNSENFYHLSQSMSRTMSRAGTKKVESPSLSQKKVMQSQEWSIRMIQKKSLQPAAQKLPPTSDLKRIKTQEQTIELTNQFERLGNRTVKVKPYDASYSQPSFNLKHNFYGAKLNSSQLQDEQPNAPLKKALRLRFAKGGLAAGTPTRMRMS
jgi:hypothetical protein